MSDLRELRDHSLCTVFAEPLESNVFEVFAILSKFLLLALIFFPTQWHANLVPPEGPYQGLPIHVVLTAPPNYPLSPPTIRLSVVTPHPNVFDWAENRMFHLSNCSVCSKLFCCCFVEYICLDMLKSYMAQVPYQGWSSAYTIGSVLLQLQTVREPVSFASVCDQFPQFLFDVRIDQEYGGVAIAILEGPAVQRAIDAIRVYRCAGCGHNGAEAPKPAISR